MMRTLFLTLLCGSALCTWGNTEPQFCVKQVAICPDFHTDKDLDEEDKIYPLTIVAEAFINKLHWECENLDDVYDDEEDWVQARYPESKTEDIVFSGTLETKAGDIICKFSNTPAKNKIQYDEGILTIVFACENITKIDLEYVLKGNVSYTTLTEDPQFLSDYYPLEDGKSFQLDDYSITTSIDEDGEWRVCIDATDQKHLERLHVIHCYDAQGKRIHSESLYCTEEDYVSAYIEEEAHSFQIEFFEQKKHSYPIEQILRIK